MIYITGILKFRSSAECIFLTDTESYSRHVFTMNCIMMLITMISDFKLSFTFTCISNGRELYSNNISGTIPSDLGNLMNLVSLDLYLNSFTGEIPESLGKLTKLRFLYDFVLSELCLFGSCMLKKGLLFFLVL